MNLVNLGGDAFALGSDRPTNGKTEIFNFRLGKWIEQASYPFTNWISRYAAVVINNGVFIIGGQDGSTGASLTTVAHFKENIWTLKGNLKRPRDRHGAITVNGLIYSQTPK